MICIIDPKFILKARSREVLQCTFTAELKPRKSVNKENI